MQLAAACTRKCLMKINASTSVSGLLRPILSCEFYPSNPHSFIPHPVLAGCLRNCTALRRWRGFAGGFPATDQSDTPGLLCRRHDRGGRYLSLSMHTASLTPPVVWSNHNRFTAFFPKPPRWACARRELLDFMVQGKINRGRHTDHQAGRHSIRTNQCPPPPSPNVGWVAGRASGL